MLLAACCLGSAARCLLRRSAACCLLARHLLLLLGPACCASSMQAFHGDTVCTVCVCPVLVCDHCRATGVETAVACGGGDVAAAEQRGRFRRWEWFCAAHGYLRGDYYHFLEQYRFSPVELGRQALALQSALSDITGTDSGQLRCAPASAGPPCPPPPPPPPSHWRDRPLLTKQVRRLKVEATRAATSAAAALPSRAVDEPAQPRSDALPRSLLPAGRPPCRCCAKLGCVGNCWGIWIPPATASKK